MPAFGTDIGSPPILRGELQGWRITCPHCGELFQNKTTCDGDETRAPYRVAALRGETLLNNHTGPPMPKMLQGHAIGGNKNRFVMATGHLVTPAIRWGPPQQEELI